MAGVPVPAREHRLHLLTASFAASLVAAVASARSPVSAGASWRFANESAFEGQQSFGLGFVSKTTGVVAGQLAIGSALWITGDSAATFKAVDWDPFELTDTAATPTALVACGDLFTGVLYSRDLGRTWNASVGDGQGIQGCTTVRRAAFDAHVVAVIGQLGFDTVNAIAVSSDDGISFTRYPIAPFTAVGAGYAALPNATTWFVTGADVDANGNPTAGEIAVTRDAGKSFSRVFAAAAGSMVLGIDCRSGDECCALESSGTKATIRCTGDSGKSWTAAYQKTGAAGKTYLNDIRFEKVTDAYWAIGGEFQADAWVLRSTADFKNFTIDTTFKGAYGTALEVAADGSGAMFGIVFETDPNDDSNDNFIITNLPK
jgi:hypothetical protein